jgi:hypothetical protein
MEGLFKRNSESVSYQLNEAALKLEEADFFGFTSAVEI